MALTKVKNSNLDDADLVALAGNDGSSLTGISVAPSSITGLTSTAAELNILDGVTSTAAELNILDGVTASTTELNYVDGVTALIQTQLDAKQASDADLTTLATNGIGTSANQLVQLNGSAQLPAVSGALLTNLPAGGATDIDGLSDGYTDSSTILPSIGLGSGALANDDGTSNGNIGIGQFALNANTSGSSNVAISGYKGLYSNTTGNGNIALGNQALRDNTTGAENIGIGGFSLLENTTASNNIAIGSNTLKTITTGHSNVVMGVDMAEYATTATGNTFIGFAGGSGSNALYNTAVGHKSLSFAQTGSSYNTAIGKSAGYAATTGNYNIFLGYKAQLTTAASSYECTLGDTNITNLRCNDTSISSLSDQRDKTNIQDIPDSAGIDFINKLRPVTYHWDRREWYEDGNPDGSKIKADWRRWKPNSGLKQGFIAQEVQTAISGEKCLEDSMIVTDVNPDKLEFAPQHLLTNAIKAIQQLSAENKALLARIEALENA
jgi:trimeric autotransporter adhesin